MNQLKNPPVLYSQRLVLRMPDVDEAPAVCDYYVRNRKHIANSQALMPESFYTPEHWQDRLRFNHKTFAEDQAVNLFVFLRRNDGFHPQVVGSVNFTSIIRRAAHFCYLGYSIDCNHQGQGYMTEAIATGIEFAFSEMNLHRIMANYIPTNKKSGQVLSRLGFVIEGYARNYLYLNGRWQDHIMTSLTNQNWRPVAPL